MSIRQTETEKIVWFDVRNVPDMRDNQRSWFVPDRAEIVVRALRPGVAVVHGRRVTSGRVTMTSFKIHTDGSVERGRYDPPEWLIGAVRVGYGQQ